MTEIDVLLKLTWYLVSGVAILWWNVATTKAAQGYLPDIILVILAAIGGFWVVKAMIKPLISFALGVGIVVLIKPYLNA